MTGLSAINSSASGQPLADAAEIAKSQFGQIPLSSQALLSRVVEDEAPKGERIQSGEV